METQNKSNISFRYQRWQRTKQPQTTSSKPYVLLNVLELDGRHQPNKQGKKTDPELLKSFRSDIKDSQQQNCHLKILQTTSSSKPYVLMSRTLIGWVRSKRDLETLLSFHSDTKDGHALLGIFQTTSSNPYILFSRNLMEGIMQHGYSEKVKSFHSEIKDDQELNSHIVVL